MASLRESFAAIAHPRILVLGDLILDRYTFGNAERVSPEAPVIVLRVDGKEVRLGGAASVALLLRGLEAQVTLAGVIGDDPEGRTLAALLQDEQIDARFVLVDSTRPTTTKERIIGRAANRHSHQIVRVDHETRDPISDVLEEDFICGIVPQLTWSRFSNLPESLTATRQGSAFSGYGAPSLDSVQPTDSATHRRSDDAPLARQNYFDAVLISDYAKGVCTPTLLRRVIDAARAAAIPVIIDPGRIADYSRYAGATLLKPNRTEAELATGRKIATPADALAAAASLQENLPAESVLVTLDRDGMVLVQAASCRFPASADKKGTPSDDSPHPGANTPGSPGSSFHLPTTPREIYDITGAGDMVLAMLGLCLASRLPLSVARRARTVE